jgi:low temperature requirement protein LtrA
VTDADHAPDADHQVTPLELFFDLVFVFAITQVTSLLAHDPTWGGVFKGMLVLAALWWAWSVYAWLTSATDVDEGGVRLTMLAAMGALFCVALAVPGAFGDHAVLFGVAYLLVRALHLVLSTFVTRGDPDRRSALVRFAPTAILGPLLLVLAGFLDGDERIAVWLVALVIDYLGPVVIGVGRGWQVAPEHFAERYALIVLIALGESIIAIGVGAEVDLTAGVVTAAVLGVGLAAAIWWTYFDVVALVTARRLTLATEGRERNMLARDSYSYLHFPMVAGIVLAALGIEETLAHVDHALDGVHAFALLGGVAVYLLAHVALRLRNAGTVNVQRLVLALALFAVIPVAMQIPALATLAGINVLLWATIAYETIRVYDERRYRLRHGLDVDPPSRGDRS